MLPPTPIGADEFFERGGCGKLLLALGGQTQPRVHRPRRTRLRLAAAEHHAPALEHVRVVRLKAFESFEIVGVDRAAEQRLPADIDERLVVKRRRREGVASVARSHDGNATCAVGAADDPQRPILGDGKRAERGVARDRPGRGKGHAAVGGSRKQKTAATRHQGDRN